MKRVRDPAWLPSGKVLRTVSFGQRLLMADYYWLKIVQYIGESVLAKQDRWEALYPLAEIATDLDPRFGYAYQVAASDLSSLAHRLEESDRLLRKGMENVPGRWSLPLAYAFNKFYYEGNFTEAAAYARKAAAVGHRPHLALLAANLSLVANQGDEYQAALAFLAEAIPLTETDELKRELAQRIVKVRTYQVLAQVEKAISAFKEQTGRLPASLREVIARSLLPNLPQDPSGGTIDYEPVSGGVRSSIIGSRQPLRVTHEE